MNKKILEILMVMILVMIPPVSAGEGGQDINLLDTLWVLIASFLVFIMHLGFAMVESGFTRAKNTVNIIMKNIMTIVIGLMVFAIIGFSIAFGSDISGFMGNAWEYIGLSGLGMEMVWAGTTISAVAFFLFQAMFAGTAATIVSGAVAERIKFIGYIIFAIVIVALIYPFVAHWVWGGGWLSEMGMIDFAGSTVVHLVGGSAALAGAIIVGARLGKYDENGKPKVIAGHSIPLAAIGGLLLWFGWYGFNPGSELAMDTAVPMIAVTTTLAAAAGAIMSMVITWLKSGKPDVGMTINGMLAGLVAITAGCAAVSPISAIMIGTFAGIIVVYAVEFFDKLKIDDPVGAISVHGICGAFGTLVVGLFAESSYGGVNGLLFGGGFSQLWVQFVGVLATFIFVFVTAFVVFKIIDMLIGLRVEKHEEVIGLDISEHATFAYPDFEIPM